MGMGGSPKETSGGPCPVTARADSPPLDYEIDHDAEEGDVVAALAALLVEVDEVDVKRSTNHEH